NAGAYQMNVGYRSDSDSGDGQHQTVDLTADTSLWGSMIWGEDPWAAGVTQTEYRVFLGALRGKRVQFKFSNQNTVDQRFKVHRANFSYNLKGFR
ncbi:MAG TPA: hypothetical protein VEF04_03580, partial [Blastocatellia bacterium]|nr:hypothetical protein [Blastocatellia bacterium]